MLTVQHAHVNRTLSIAHQSPLADEIISAYNSAKRLRKPVKVSIYGDVPVLHPAGTSPNRLTSAWWTLNQSIKTKEEASEVFGLLQEMGLPVSALDAKYMAQCTEVPEGGFPF